jgi:hypothetical protein
MLHQAQEFCIKNLELRIYVQKHDGMCTRPRKTRSISTH